MIKNALKSIFATFLLVGLLHLGYAGQATAQQAQQERSILPVQYEDSWVDATMFWTERMIIPEREVPWHGRVIEQLRVDTEEEFYRTGFVRRNDVWIPVFFLRRFQMMRNVYQHYLVIKGEPDLMTGSVGISEEDYGTVISNEGYDLYMPTVASVSRDEKSLDDQESLELATLQLETYGFTDVTWFEDEDERRGTIAEEWIIEEQE